MEEFANIHVCLVSVVVNVTCPVWHPKLMLHWLAFRQHPSLFNLCRRKRSSGSPIDNLAARVSSKLEDGDVRGAIRLAASDDTIAPFNDVTAAVLRSKHPSRAAPDSQSPTPNSDSSIALHESDILSAIKAFLARISWWTWRPSSPTFKNLTSESAGDAGHRLVTRLTEFANMCLKGNVPVDIQPVFCGASLCALAKKDGGIRLIAVGSTLRRLISRAACKKVSKKMATEFSPIQLGFGIARASESVAHATRSYVSNLQSGQGLLKLDFCNAFNMVHRDNLFQTVFTTYCPSFTRSSTCVMRRHRCSMLNFGDYLLSIRWRSATRGSTWFATLLRFVPEANSQHDFGV